MRLIQRHAPLALATLLAIVVTACTSPKSSAEQAVYCAKCETVWVDVLDLNDPYRATYTSEKRMQCPDCQSAVESFFKTGRFEHSCDTCGSAVVHCTRHE